MDVKERAEVERKIVAHLFSTMAAHGWHVDYIFDGENHVRLARSSQGNVLDTVCIILSNDGYDGENNVRYANFTQGHVLDTVFSVDESTIRFMKSDMRRRVRIVLGNDGYDCIADHSLSDKDNTEDDFEAVMKLVDDYSTSLESSEAGD